jgi:hypothetical protein
MFPLRWHHMGTSKMYNTFVLLPLASLTSMGPFKEQCFFDTGPDRLYKIYTESVSHFGPDGLIWIT